MPKVPTRGTLAVRLLLFVEPPGGFSGEAGLIFDYVDVAGAVDNDLRVSATRAFVAAANLF